MVYLVQVQVVLGHTTDSAIRRFNTFFVLEASLAFVRIKIGNFKILQNASLEILDIFCSRMQVENPDCIASGFRGAGAVRTGKGIGSSADFAG